MQREQQASTTGNSRSKQKANYPRHPAQGLRDAVATNTGQKLTNGKNKKNRIEYLASLELTPLLALLRRPGIFLIPARRQAMPQPLDELLVFLLRHPALLGGLLLRDLAALGGR